MLSNYVGIETSEGTVLVRKDVAKNLKFDSIAFDCDGVLIDARNSYDMAIVFTLSKLIEILFGVKINWKDKIPNLIYSLRATGRFNNDWDTTYALLLFSSWIIADKLGIDLNQDHSGFLQLNRNKSESLYLDLEMHVKNFVSFVNGEVNKNVDQLLNLYFSNGMDSQYKRIKGIVNYPGNPPNSLLSSLFDEVYYGPKVFKDMYGVERKYYKGHGFIDNDKVLVKRETLEDIKSIFKDKIILITGRPFKATEYSLKGLMNYFNIDASVFIGDADRSKELRYLKDFKKPSPLSLLHVNKRLNSNGLLYVADSAEDIKMVQEAKSYGHFYLSGVYGATLDSERQKNFFVENNAELIIPNVNVLPEIIKGIKS